ncbi:response regulator [Flavobacterium sp. MFBS3-15]|uniref:response regulator n=1 Tax=Flavobacterium sp. MFBS3-15 TaxID=2989816 RepID=UPI0022356194|nr:response regulator [Flavobacterium sp. MFBS3-15]MCW4467661.1 response regulator [Flavobacterium sp. MFBS3-15]
MSKRGPIIVIDDDEDDREIMREILESLGQENAVVTLPDGDTALDYLRNTAVKPFMVISDINMPKMNGYELRDRILRDELLSRKCVPYIFFTTSAAEETVEKAYQLSVQGFFHKVNDYNHYRSLLEKVLSYWKEADIPKLGIA